MANQMCYILLEDFETREDAYLFYFVKKLSLFILGTMRMDTANFSELILHKLVFV